MDLQKIADLHSDTFAEFIEYIVKYIHPFTLKFSKSEVEWVPYDILQYIAFSKRLAQFKEIALEAHHMQEVPMEEAIAFKQCKLRKFFLSKLATFLFLVNEEPTSNDMELPHLALGNV